MENDGLAAVGAILLGVLIAVFIFVARNWIYWVEANDRRTDRKMRQVKDRLRRSETPENDFSWLDEEDDN